MHWQWGERSEVDSAASHRSDPQFAGPRTFEPLFDSSRINPRTDRATDQASGATHPKFFALRAGSSVASRYNPQLQDQGPSR